MTSSWSSSPLSHGSTGFYWHETEFNDRSFQVRGRALFLAIFLFTASLLVALLFIYIRRICLISLPQPDEPPPPSRFAGGGGGLDPAAIRRLQVKLCRREEGATTAEKEECCICLGGFEDGDKVKVLPRCRHFYHCECVDRWLRNESRCPLCRVSVRVDSSLERDETLPSWVNFV